MSEMSIAEVKSLWKSKLWAQGDSFNLYIDSPFCVSKCKFCVHHGTTTAIGSDIYKKYYNDILIKQFEIFEDIINIRPIDTVYFGGGTPSLMTVPIMRNIFDRIPRVKEIRFKELEAHPAFLTESKIDTLAEYGFNYISLGVQTFNKEINATNNRVIVSSEKLNNIIKYAQNKGICVNCDLLVFIENKNLEKDIETFETDLAELNKFGPDVITIYPMYQRFNSSFDLSNQESLNQELIDYDINKILKMRRVAYKFTWNSSYELMYSKKSLNKDVIKNNLLTDIYLSKLETKKFNNLGKYNCSSYPYHLANQNTLGLGGYAGRTTYSYLGKQVYYQTKILENGEPTFTKISN